MSNNKLFSLVRLILAFIGVVSSSLFAAYTPRFWDQNKLDGNYLCESGESKINVSFNKDAIDYEKGRNSITTLSILPLSSDLRTKFKSLSGPASEIESAVDPIVIYTVSSQSYEAKLIFRDHGPNVTPKAEFSLTAFGIREWSCVKR